MTLISPLPNLTYISQYDCPRNYATYFLHNLFWCIYFVTTLCPATSKLPCQNMTVWVTHRKAWNTSIALVRSVPYACEPAIMTGQMRLTQRSKVSWLLREWRAYSTPILLAAHCKVRLRTAWAHCWIKESLGSTSRTSRSSKIFAAGIG